MHHVNILILGGTTEASALARALAHHATVLSLAGVTKRPLAQPVPVRSGGFGGVAGLIGWLRANRTEILVDATHPFATVISANARQAAAATGVRLVRVCRPSWVPVAGDRWTVVNSMAAAAAALGPTSRRVLLTVGQKELAVFAARPWHRYVVRSVEPALLPGATIITATGPFAEPEERALLLAHGIEVMVAKNSGGGATRAKLDAARGLGVPVLMVARPEAEPGDAVADVATALASIEAHAGTLRGV